MIFSGWGKRVAGTVAVVLGAAMLPVLAAAPASAGIPVFPIAEASRQGVGNGSITATVDDVSMSLDDTLVVSVATGTFAGDVGCSDSVGNNYRVEVDKNTGAGRLFVCVAHNGHALEGGDTVSASYPKFSGLSFMSVIDWSNLSTATVNVTNQLRGAIRQ